VFLTGLYLDRSVEPPFCIPSRIIPLRGDLFLWGIQKSLEAAQKRSPDRGTTRPADEWQGEFFPTACAWNAGSLKNVYTKRNRRAGKIPGINGKNGAGSGASLFETWLRSGEPIFTVG
jgi:hypothetical protein